MSSLCRSECPIPGCGGATADTEVFCRGWVCNAQEYTYLTRSSPHSYPQID